MLSVCVEVLPFALNASRNYDLDGPLSLSSLRDWARNVLSCSVEDVYFVHNGRKVQENKPLSEGVVRVLPRLPGGKGGFGSMLRAIGAQIEKTTNREACRDLSGRRLRDINEEKRLKNWISKKAEREREAIERKQRKLEKLRSEPKVEFSDKKYEEERSKLSDVVHDAVEKGFQASSSKPSTSAPTKKPARKVFMFEEEELSNDSDLSSSDEQSEADNNKPSKRAAESDSDSDEPSPAKRPHVDKTDSSKSSEGSDSEDTREKSPK